MQINSLEEAEAYAATLPKQAAAESAASLPTPADMCAAWSAAKPLVSFLWPKLSMLLPAKITLPINYLITLLDGFCAS